MGEQMNKSKDKNKQMTGGLTGSDKLKREGKGNEEKGREDGTMNGAKGEEKHAKKSVK